MEQKTFYQNKTEKEFNSLIKFVLKKNINFESLIHLIKQSFKKIHYVRRKIRNRQSQKRD
jgi:phenylalanyl-tRNA synthetase alpha subunit